MPLFESEGRRPILEAGPEHYLEGKIGDCLIVSVPPSTTHESCRLLREQLCEATGKPDSRILILTHNIEFLRAQRLGAKEASMVAKFVDDTAPERQTQEDGGPSTAQEEATA
jgi:hypothetical protein